jgi:hypothetical protein
MHRITRGLCAVAWLCASCVFFSAKAETEKYDCASATGWALTDLQGGTPAGATLAPANGATRVNYQRATLTPIFHHALLTEFKELRLKLHSQNAGTFAVIIKDRDGATFNKPFELPAQTDAEIRLKPGDFKLNEDSFVDKEMLDSYRAGGGFIIMDLGAITGVKGENTLTIKELAVERSDLAVEKGDLVVEGRTRIDRSVVREGNIIVKDGGYLKIKASRFVLNGDVLLDGGVLEIDGSLVVVPQRFNHERKVMVQKKGLLIYRDVLLATIFPYEVSLRNGGTLDFHKSECTVGLSCNADESAKIQLRNAKLPGEFILAPGTSVEIADSESVFLWLPAGKNLTGNLTLPPGKRITKWTGDQGISVSISNSTNVNWCLLSTPGANGTIEQSEIYGVGVLFDGESTANLNGVKNQMPLPNFKLNADDRKLSFNNSKVRAWNFYASHKATVNLTDCVFGEALSFGDGKIVVNKSVCDGSGGYVGAKDSSQIQMTDSKITCLVVARDRSNITLTNCEIAGDIRAAGTGKVILKNCKVSGRLEHDPQASIIRE